MAQGRSHTPEQNARIRAAAGKLRERYKSQVKLAEALGMLQPSLSNYLNGRYEAGPALARKIAELSGLTLEELLGERVEATDRYPNRAEAVRVARRDGLSEAAIEVVLSAALQSEDDLPIIEWIDAIRDEARRQRRFATDPHMRARVIADAERATETTPEDEEGALTRADRLEAEREARENAADEEPAQIVREAPRVVRRMKKS